VSNALDGCAMDATRRSSDAVGIRTRVADMARLRVRGLAPSLGAGGSLVVAGLICLVGVSAMLAFRGWPGTDGARPDGSLSLRTPDAKASGRAAPGPLPAVALTDATTADAADASDAADAGGGATARTRGAAPGRSDRSRDRRGPVAGAPETPATTTPPATGTQPAPVTTAPPADTGGGGSDSGGGSGGGGSGGGGTGGGGGGGGGAAPAPGPVQQVVGTGRQTVTELTAPLPVPPAVEQPVDDVLDATEGVARTVDGVVDQVPVVGETVDGVTGVLLP
jgi:hypothetical protein